MNSQTSRQTLKRVLLGLCAALLLLAAVSGYAFGYRHSLPPGSESARAIPAFDKLPRLKVCWIESAKAVGNTASGILIDHGGSLYLLDAGNSMHFDEEVDSQPFQHKLWLKLMPGALKPTVPMGDLIRRAGFDPAALRWALISHEHLDHLGGLLDLPGFPILTPQEEIDFVRQGQRTDHILAAHRTMLLARGQAITFAPTRYEVFDESADLFGDGSVVVVKLFGHTPGSIGTFINLSPTRRLFHVGDAVQDTRALTHRIGKPPVMAGTDVDPVTADRVVSRLTALQQLVPTLHIIPAHGRDAWIDFFGQPGCTESP